MNKDTVINRIAHITGCSRKEVIATLKQFGIFTNGIKSKGNNSDL